jgi:peptide/nickel transport system permease protein
LFEQVKHMENGPARQALIDRMMAILHEDAPWSFGFHPKDYGLHPRLGGQPEAQPHGAQRPQVPADRRGAARTPARRMEPPGAVAARPVAVLLAASAAPALWGWRRREQLEGARLMLAYIIRRLLYAIPILIGVNLLTFTLFFVVNTPDDMARMQLGVKRVTPEAIEKWKAERGYDKPLLYNENAAGAAKLTDTIFFEKSAKLFVLRFRPRRRRPRHRPRDQDAHGPSLAIAVPVFVLGLFVTVSFALLLAFFRATYLDFWGVVLCVAMMSISSLFYIIGGQYLVSKVWHLVPISGYAGGLDAARFLLLPVLISVVAGIGSSTRWYRTIFLEEIGKDYVRTARAKGLSETGVLFRHVLRNAMIPILTGVVVVIPLLFMGSLLVESFFGIPGLGSYTIDAINAQDFAVVRAMVFIGSVLYIVGLLLTDLSYTLVDPARETAMMPIVLWTDLLVFLLIACGIGAGSTSAARVPAGLLAPRRREPRRHGLADRAAGLRRCRPARFAALPAAPGSGQRSARPTATAAKCAAPSMRCCSRSRHVPRRPIPRRWRRTCMPGKRWSCRTAARRGCSRA